MGTPLLLAVRKSANGPGNLLVRLHVFYTGIDTLEDAVLPDSAITTLQRGRRRDDLAGHPRPGSLDGGGRQPPFQGRSNGGLGSLRCFLPGRHLRRPTLRPDPGRRVPGPNRGDRIASLAGGPDIAPVCGQPNIGIALRLPGLPDSLQPIAGRGQPRLRVLADGRIVTAPERSSGRSEAHPGPLREKTDP